MSDPLSDTFRANVEAVRIARDLSMYQLGKIVTPNDPRQFRTQMVRGAGFTLATVHTWSERLGIDPLAMLAPPVALRRVS